LAEKLGKFVHQIEELTPDEFAEYLAYYKIRADEDKKEARKLEQQRARKGRRR